MTQDADKPKIREFLFERGYGDDPKAYISKRNRAKLQHTDAPSTPTETPEENSKNREAATDRFLSLDPPKKRIQIQLVKDDTGIRENIHIYQKGETAWKASTCTHRA